jgi:TonB dependent receptor-like, beta-barrel
VTQPLNGDDATLTGLELAFQNQLQFLPSPFNGIGVYANYTLTDSTAKFPNHRGDSTLPGQSRHVGNLALSFEKRGFASRSSVNFHGSYIDVVGADNTQDRFYDTNRQFDLSLSQKLTHNLRVYSDFMNLNDALLRYYQGVPDRVLQEEHYHWWMNFGVKVEFWGGPKGPPLRSAFAVGRPFQGRRVAGLNGPAHDSCRAPLSGPPVEC